MDSSHELGAETIVFHDDAVEAPGTECSNPAAEPAANVPEIGSQQTQEQALPATEPVELEPVELVPEADPLPIAPANEAISAAAEETASLVVASPAASEADPIPLVPEAVDASVASTVEPLAEASTAEAELAPVVDPPAAVLLLNGDPVGEASADGAAFDAGSDPAAAIAVDAGVPVPESNGAAEAAGVPVLAIESVAVSLVPATEPAALSLAPAAAVVVEEKRYIPPGYHVQHGVLYSLSEEGPELIYEVREWENKENLRVNKWGELIFDTDRDQERQSMERKQEEKLLKNLVRDNERELKWIEMTRDWAAMCKNNYKLVKSRIRKGIPDSFRGQIWPLLCSAQDERKKHPMLYQQLLLKTISRADDIQIRKDLPREYQNHVQFASPDEGSKEVFSKGQVAMYNVFHAWSVYNQEIGYVQGMMTIGGLCLMYVTEEEAFWMLERLLHGPNQLKGIYADKMPLSHEYIWVFDELLRIHCPKLRKHLEKENLSHYNFWFRWLTTRFSEFPKALVVRIFDMFLLEGMKVVFRMAMFICRSLEKQLLKMDFEGMMGLMNGLPTAPEMLDVDEIMNNALKIDITRKQLRKLSERYASEQAIAKLKASKKR